MQALRAPLASKPLTVRPMAARPLAAPMVVQRTAIVARAAAADEVRRVPQSARFQFSWFYHRFLETMFDQCFIGS